MNLVAENIERIIEEKGMKKKVVARRAGITDQKLSDMLAGRAVIRAEIIPNICHALDVEPNALYHQTGGREAEA